MRFASFLSARAAALLSLQFGSFGSSVTRPTPPPGGHSYRKSGRTRRGPNLRLHLGPSDAGRLMRNRTPQPGPVRLTVHDWYRRKHFGTSKRMRNMTDAERTRAHQIIEEVRLGRKV